jgi:hypothetical protein
MSAGLRRQQQQQLNGVQPVRELSSQPASHALAAIVEPPIIPCPVPLSTAGATRSRQATNPRAPHAVLSLSLRRVLRTLLPIRAHRSARSPSDGD